MFVTCKTRHNLDGSWWAMAREQGRDLDAGGMGTGSSEEEAVENAVDSLKKIFGIGEESVVRLPLASSESRMMGESDVALFEAPESDEDLEDLDGSVTAKPLDDDDWEDDEDDDYDDDEIESFCSRELAEELINRLAEVHGVKIGDWCSRETVSVLSRLSKILNRLLGES